MPGRLLLLQSVVILWLVQAAHTGGYGAASGVSNGHGPQPNGKKLQNGGGVGRMLMPSKGVGQAMGAQNGYGGYPTKGLGYGVQAGPTNGQQMKGNGYGAHAGGYSRQGTKGYNAAAGVPAGNGAKPNGGAAATHSGYGTKGNGHGAGSGVPNGNGKGATAGPSNGNGARPNGQGVAGSKPMKGYGRPHYGAGPGLGMGASRMGVPQLARNKAYGANGYNGNGAQPMGGYNGGYGSAGLGLGPRYGNGGMKGPKPGYGAAAGVPNGQAPKPNGYAGARVPNGNGAVPNGYGYPNGGATKPAKPGYGNTPNGYGAKPNGYGATRGGAMKPQPGYGNGAVPNGYGGKPNSHGVRNGAALGGYGGKLNGYGGPSRGSKPQTTKGFGPVSPSEGAKTLDTGYGGPAGVPNGHLGAAANTGYMMPNGKSTKGAGMSNEKGLKGGVLSPVQPSATPEELVASPQATTQGPAPVALEPTSGIVVMVTQEKYQKLPSTVPQGKTYKQTPQATPEPAPAVPQGKGPKLAPEPTPEPAPMGPQGKGPKGVTSGPAPVDPQTDPAPEPAAVVPQGYVTGSAVPEQKAAEADALFGVDGTSEGDVVPESTKALKTKAVPETVAAKSTGSIAPEETLAVGVPEVAPEEASIKRQPEAGPDGLGVNGLPAGETGATENGGGASVSKGQGTKPTKPDCGPSGVPNGQWMKIPRPGYNAGTGASTDTNTKGYGAGAGAPPRYGAKPNGYGAGGYTGRSFGYGLRYPYAGKSKQPGYGQGAYLGAGYGNGNSYGGNGGLGEAGKSKSGNGYSAGIQPDYASLGQGVPAANGKSGGAKQMPYNGAPMIPVGLDGMSQFEPQSAGLDPNGKMGSMYGGMRGLPFGSQSLGMGAEKSNAKYGIGGLQFGGQPFSTGTNGAGKYGYGGSPYGPAGDGKSSGKYGGVGTSMGGDPAPAQYGYGGFPNGGQLLGNTAGKYGYGRMPYEAQPAGLNPEAKSTGKYALAGSPHQPEPLGNGQNGEVPGKYGGGDVPYAPQALGYGSEAKSYGKYDNQGPYLPQPLESASESRSGGEYDVAGLPYELLPGEPDAAGKAYVNGDVPTPAIAVEGEGMSVHPYENVGYINGQVQPEVVAFPAAPTPSPTLAYPSVPAYPPVESFTPGAGVEDLADPEGTAGLAHDSAPATETQGAAQVPEQPDDLFHQQQLPRQIHIQQHLKLHFHPQGAKNSKYGLNGFFGNSG